MSGRRWVPAAALVVAACGILGWGWLRRRPAPPIIAGNAEARSDSTSSESTSLAKIEPNPISVEIENRTLLLKALFRKTVRELTEKLSLTAEQSSKMLPIFYAEADWWVGKFCPEGATEPRFVFETRFPKSQEARDRTLQVEEKLKEILTPPQWEGYRSWAQERNRVWFLYEPNGHLVLGGK